MSGRKNYTVDERNYLVSLVKEKVNIVECPRTDGSSMAEKDKAWNAIGKDYNKSNIIQFQRTPEQLKKLWKNIKQAQKNDTIKERQARTGSVGGVETSTTNPDFDPNSMAPFFMNTPMFSSNLSSEKLANRQKLLDVAGAEHATNASPSLMNDVDEEIIIPDELVDNLKLNNLSQLGINGLSPKSNGDRIEASTSQSQNMSSRKRQSKNLEEFVERLKIKRLSNLIEQEKELHELKMKKESEIYDIRISHLRKIMRLEEETTRAKLKVEKLSDN